VSIRMEYRGRAALQRRVRVPQKQSHLQHTASSYSIFLNSESSLPNEAAQSLVFGFAFSVSL